MCGAGELVCHLFDVQMVTKKVIVVIIIMMTPTPLYNI